MSHKMSWSEEVLQDNPVFYSPNRIIKHERAPNELPVPK